MCGVTSLTELRDPLLCLSFLWNSPLIPVAAMVAQNPFSFPPARKMPGFLSDSQLQQHKVRLLCDWCPLSGQSPLKAGDCLSLWDAPHFESPLRSACLQCTVQNPQVIGFCIMSRICSCCHWEGWSIGSLYNKTCIKSSVLSVFSLWIIKQLCVLDESTPLTL